MPLSIDPVSTSATFRAAQTASVVVSAAAAGANLGLSVFLIPRLLESPTGLMLRQWQHMYDVGKIVFPGSASAATLAYAYVYYAGRRSLAGSHVLVASKAPLVAAGLCIAILPYTLLLLLPTNQKLFTLAAAAEADARVSKADRAAGAGVSYSAQDEASAKQLVDRWGTLNVGRSVLLTAAAVVGLLAYL